VPSAAASSAPPSIEPGGSAAVASPTASASTDPTVARIYDTIEGQVVEIRGLQPGRPVERAFIDETELRSQMTALVDQETPPAALAAKERLYKALGLIPADASLRDLTVDLLSGGVAGFYRDDQAKLYVVSKSGEPGVMERFTFAHEYDHALQDQAFSVFKDQVGILDQGDRIFARQAVYEGDGTLLMTLWAASNLTQAELLELVGLANDPESAALMQRTPAILRETLAFPYTTGLAFIQRIHADGGWAAVDDVYDRMPASTEQILHPERYAADEAPVAVTLPADLAERLGAGWTVPMEDTFGELQLGIWLREGGVVRAAAAAAAAGWGGDRLAVMQGPDGAWAVAIQTVWDTTADAAAFEAAATTALAGAGGVGQILPGDGGTTRWVVVADDADTLGLVAGVLGLAG
jgi:hypothetical protein